MQTILIELTFSYSNTNRVLVVLSVKNNSTTTMAGEKEALSRLFRDKLREGWGSCGRKFQINIHCVTNLLQLVILMAEQLKLIAQVHRK